MGNSRNLLVDALKGVAILSVVLFHLGWFKYGYWGVDVFYVIAGYFTTIGVWRDIEKGCYNPFAFVWKRLMRVLPVVVAVALVCIVVGVLFYLPIGMMDVSRNGLMACLFLSNFDLWRTTNDYWSTTNDVNPLMHLWYLGTLVQFYVVYALIWWPKKCRWSMPFVYSLGIASLGLVILKIGDAGMRYYLLPWRFFEFVIGAAIAQHPSVLKPFSRIHMNGWWLKGLATLGLMSLSIYIWHQPILAFSRYLVSQEFSPMMLLVMLGLLVVSPWLSFHFLECKIESMKGRVILIIAYLMTVGATFLVWENSGVSCAIPEFDIKFGRYEKGFIYKYNDRVRTFTDDFKNDGRVKVLVVGDSYARDWANVLLESSFSNRIDLVYCCGEVAVSRRHLLDDAGVIFYSVMLPVPLPDYLKGPKTWVVGTKYYGITSQTYTRRFTKGYADMHVKLPQDIAERNEADKKRYGKHFIDMIGMVQNAAGEVRCFTDDHKFISIDMGHLAPAGARYYARMLETFGWFECFFGRIR